MSRSFVAGSSQSLTLADYLPFRGNADSFAVLVRFKRGALGTSTFLTGKGNAASTTEGWSIFFDAADLPYVRINDGSARRAMFGPAVSDTTAWHTLVLVVDRTLNKIIGYLDGSTAGFAAQNFGGGETDSLSGVGSIDPTGTLYIGCRGDGALFSTLTISEYAVLVARVPTQAEITAWHGGVVAEKVFGQGYGMSGCWPMVGSCLQDVSNATQNLVLTANNSPTIAADPPLYWPGDVAGVAFDADALAGSAGTLMTAHTTDGGNSWVRHGDTTTYPGTLELDGSNRIRWTTGITGFAHAYINFARRSRTTRVECNLTPLTQPGNTPTITVGADPSVDTCLYAQRNETFNSWTVGQRVGGVNTVLGYGPPATPVNGQSYAMRLEVSGGRIACVVDGQLVAVGRSSAGGIAKQYAYVGVRYTGAVAEANGEGWRVGPLTITEGRQCSDLEVGTNGGGSSSFAGVHLPGIVATTGYVIAGWEARIGSVNDAALTDIRIRRRARPYGSNSWGPAINVIADGTGGSASFQADYNPNLFVDLNGTTVRNVFVRSPNGVTNVNAPAGNADGGTTTQSVWIITSTDQGATWGSPVEITSQVKLSSWAGVTVGPGAGLTIPSGTYAGRMVVGVSGNDAATHNVWAGHVVYSDDNGATWSRSATFAGNPSESSVAFDPVSGLVWYLPRRNPLSGDPDKASKLFYYSSDGGATWTAASEEPELRSPVDGAGSNNCFSPVRYDSVTGRMLVGIPNSLHRQSATIRYSGAHDLATWDDPSVQTYRGRMVGGNRVGFHCQGYTDVLPDPDDADTILLAVVEGDAMNPASYSDRAVCYQVPRAFLGITAPASGAGAAVLSASSLGVGWL